MLRLLSGVKWFEWVLIGALLISGLLVSLGFQRYLKERDSNTVLTEQYGQLQRASEYRQHFYTLADAVVAKYVKESVSRRDSQSKARDDDSVAFLALAHPALPDVLLGGFLPLPGIEDHVDALRFEHSTGGNSPAVKSSKEPFHAPTRKEFKPLNERVEQDPLVIAALTDLANRMRTRSCAAGAVSADCRP